jgi:hypothetical protein
MYISIQYPLAAYILPGGYLFRRLIHQIEDAVIGNAGVLAEQGRRMIILCAS